MVISEKEWVLVDFGIKLKLICAPYNDRNTHFTQNVTYCLFCGSASYMYFTLEIAYCILHMRGMCPLRSREKCIIQIILHDLVQSLCLRHPHKVRRPISAKNRGCALPLPLPPLICPCVLKARKQFYYIKHTIICEALWIEACWHNREM